MVWFELKQVYREFGSPIAVSIICFVLFGPLTMGSAGWVFMLLLIPLWGQALYDYYKYSSSPFGLFGKPPTEFTEYNQLIWDMKPQKMGRFLKELFIARGYHQVSYIKGSYVTGYTKDKRVKFLAGWRVWRGKSVTITQIRNFLAAADYEFQVQEKWFFSISGYSYNAEVLAKEANIKTIQLEDSRGRVSSDTIGFSQLCVEAFRPKEDIIQPEEVPVVQWGKGSVSTSKESENILTHYSCIFCRVKIANSDNKCSYCGKTQLECHICRKKIIELNELVECPFCHCYFHNVHIREWLRVKGACSNCKRKLSPTELISYD